MIDIFGTATCCWGNSPGAVGGTPLDVLIARPRSPLQRCASRRHPDDASAPTYEDAVRFVRLIVWDEGSEIDIRSAARTNYRSAGVVGQAVIQFDVFHRTCPLRHITFNFDCRLALRFKRRTITKSRFTYGAKRHAFSNAIVEPSAHACVRWWIPTTPEGGHATLHRASHSRTDKPVSSGKLTRRVKQNGKARAKLYPV